MVSQQPKRGGPPKTGGIVSCAKCGTEFYKKRSRIVRDKLHLCSEPCRLAAIRENRIDRRCRDGGLKKRTGETFRCCICGDEKYQKRSHIDRNVNKTCGDRNCISAYSRSLWGLPPRTEEERLFKRARPTQSRATNFTASQRAKWIGDHCAQCGATENLCLDHVIPVSAGGRSVRDNAQTLCQPCNIRKVAEFDLPYTRALGG